MAKSSRPAKTAKNKSTVRNSRTTVSGPAEPDASGGGDIVEKAGGTRSDCRGQYGDRAERLRQGRQRWSEQPDGTEAVSTLGADGRTLEFIKDQYRHCKPIPAVGASDQLLAACGIDTALPNGQPDPGVITPSDASTAASDGFVAAVAKHRHFARDRSAARVMNGAAAHTITRRDDMAEAGTLHDAFIDELRDTYDAEKQLTKALPMLAKAASNPKLRQAFESHLQETQGQITRLEQVFESLDEKVRGKHCDGIAGIIEEGKSIMEEDFDETTMDACLIAAGQRAEHYEMAAYGTLVAWSQAMGHTEASKLLQQTLDEEKAADKKLSGLAEGGINQGAADAAHADEDDEPVGAGARGARKSSGKAGRR
jgi:ferritin-like metal-binding protein YciE